MLRAIFLGILAAMGLVSVADAQCVGAGGFPFNCATGGNGATGFGSSGVGGLVGATGGSGGGGGQPRAAMEATADWPAEAVEAAALGAAPAQRVATVE